MHRLGISLLIPLLLVGSASAGKRCYFEDAEGTCIDKEDVEPIHLLQRGMPYSKVRTALIAKGYVPGTTSGSNDERCSIGRDECQTYPETIACSGTGRAFCTFLFNKNDSHYAVHTYGEDALYGGASFVSEQHPKSAIVRRVCAMSYVQIDPSEKRRLDALRARAKRAGIGIAKGRGEMHLNQRGGLMVFDRSRNAVIDGANFELTVAQAEERVADLIRD